MIEIIALVFVVRDIGRLAKEKGLKPLTWKIHAIFSWIAFEFLGIIAGYMIFDKTNIVSIVLVGLLFAITSYYLIRARLNKFPDASVEDSINNIGE